jgi:hypothetical protein
MITLTNEQYEAASATIDASERAFFADVQSSLVTNHRLFTTNGTLLDANGFETNSGVWAFMQGEILIVNATPHAIWDVRVFPDRIVSKASGWTLLF